MKTGTMIISKAKFKNKTKRLFEVQSLDKINFLNAEIAHFKGLNLNYNFFSFPCRGRRHLLHVHFLKIKEFIVFSFAVTSAAAVETAAAAVTAAAALTTAAAAASTAAAVALKTAAAALSPFVWH